MATHSISIPHIIPAGTTVSAPVPGHGDLALLLDPTGNPVAAMHLTDERAHLVGKIVWGERRADGRHLVNVGHDRGGKMDIARLAAALAYGPPPEGAVIEHLDGDPSNNRAGNVAWGTYQTNNAARPPFTRLDPCAMKTVQLCAALGMPSEPICAQLGLSRASVSRVKNRMTRPEALLTGTQLLDLVMRCRLPVPYREPTRRLRSRFDVGRPA